MNGIIINDMYKFIIVYIYDNVYYLIKTRRGRITIAKWYKIIFITRTYWLIYI